MSDDGCQETPLVSDDLPVKFGTEPEVEVEPKLGSDVTQKLSHSYEIWQVGYQVEGGTRVAAFTHHRVFDKENAERSAIESARSALRVLETQGLGHLKVTPWAQLTKYKEYSTEMEPIAFLPLTADVNSKTKNKPTIGKII